MDKGRRLSWVRCSCGARLTSGPEFFAHIEAHPDWKIIESSSVTKDGQRLALDELTREAQEMGIYEEEVSKTKER